MAIVAKTGDPAPLGNSFSLFGNTPAIDGNTVAFHGSYNFQTGIFTGSGGTITTIAKKFDPAALGYFTSFGNPALNGTTAAFVGEYVGGSGVFRGSGGALTTIVKTGDPAPSGTFKHFNAVAINGSTVAFFGDYDGGSGIFIGDGGPLTTVIKSGDLLFGSPVSFASNNTFGPTGFDSGGSGNLAFHYQLANLRDGIAMATPQVVTPVDYNRNGIWDMADYVVWRNTLGQVGIGLPADGNVNGRIDSGDYDVWRSRYGQVAGSGAGDSFDLRLATVPEPASCALVTVASLTVLSALTSKRSSRARQTRLQPHGYAPPHMDERDGQRIARHFGVALGRFPPLSVVRLRYTRRACAEVGGRRCFRHL